MLAFTFLIFLFCLFPSESYAEGSSNGLPENAYAYQCGPSKVVCYFTGVFDCSKLINVQIILIRIKFESELGLPEYGMGECYATNKSGLNGMTFSEEGVPMSGSKELETKKLFVMSQYTIYKYTSDNNTFERHGCVCDPKNNKNFLYVSDYEVGRLYDKLDDKSNGTKDCNEYFLILQNQDPLAYFGRPPVILIPGFFASEIDSRLNNVEGPLPIVKQEFFRGARECDRDKRFYKIWLHGGNLWNLITPTLKCWKEYVILTFNETTNRTQNRGGVETRIPDWGGTEAVEAFGPLLGAVGYDNYFANIVNSLKSFGYDVDKNIRAAGYDFRKAPNEAEDYVEKLQTLVEETYELNEQNKVVFIAHSMGNMYSLYFFNKMSREWKNKYIKAFISLAAPWGGSPLAINMYVRGEVLDIPEAAVPANEVRPVQRSFPSAAFLLPTKQFWRSNETLATFNGKNYTTANYEEFFQDLHLPQALRMWQLTKDLISDMKSPEVPIYCVVGYGTRTPKRYNYGNISTDPDEAVAFPDVTTGEGDGLVNSHSAKGCMRWKKELKDSFHIFFIKDQHKLMLRNRKLIFYIESVLLKEATS